MILFLGQTPPPVHGASIMNAKAWETLSEHFPHSILINITNASSLDDVGAASLNKVIRILFLYFKIIITLLNKRPKICYFALCPNGAAFYRDTLIIAILKAFRVKRIIHLHGRGLIGASNSIKSTIARYSMSGADVIHLSETFWQELNGLIPRKRFWIVPNCAEDLSQCRRKRHAHEPINFFYFSNFVRGKGALYILQAAKILYHQQVRCRISLAGGWSDMELKSDIERWKSENSDIVASGFVTFHGPLYGQDKIDFITKGDVLVFPSYIDTFPLVVVEALSAGKPVIASATGAIPEILGNGEGGLVFQEHNVIELVEHVKTLTNDSSLIRKLSDSGRLRYERLYQEQAFRDTFLETIRRILINKDKQCAE